MPIRVLDDKLINQIAAGEVVERPASVVKELVENAIDAGSTRINISITRGGMDEIMVEDDGQGMEAEELVLAFARHATSKIGVEEDLLNIRTLGFRGEALPSIASVARVKMVTASREGEGSFINIEGGEVIETGPQGCPRGSWVTVQDLFFNTPARRKFLKSPVTESNHIYDLVSKLALSHPNISFTLANEKRVVFKTPGNGSLPDVIHCIFGQDFLAGMTPVDYQQEEIEVRGMVSRPEFTRSNRKHQVFIVNQRVVRSPLLFRALDEAYRGLLVSREFPAAVLFLRIAPDRVDVNVHPQKAEVRFRDEKGIFNLVRQVVRSVLVDKGLIPGRGLVNQTEINNGIAEPAAGYEPEAGLWEQRPGLPLMPRRSTIVPYWSKTVDISGLRPVEWSRNVTEPAPGETGVAGDIQLLGQWLDSYIVVAVGEDLWLVDQHAAHERVLYEKLVSSGRRPQSQPLVLPVSFHLAAGKIQVLGDNLEVYREFGFEMDILGYNSVVLRAAPALIKGREVEVIDEMLDLLAEGRPEDLLVGERVFALMACKSAIKAGTSLQRPEMGQLIKDWLESDNYRHCPHGRPVVVVLTPTEIERRLKRRS